MRKKASNMLFVLPSVLAIAVFFIYPMCRSVVMSFYSTNLVKYNFVGLMQYRFALTDSSFWVAVKNTLLMLVMTFAVVVPSSFLIAVMINSVKRGKTFFKIGYYMPNLTSVVVAVIMMKYVFHTSESGVLNYMLGLFGAQPVLWTVFPFLSKVTVVLTGAWIGLGYDILLYLAGLQGIPSEIYEAADIDGATALPKLFHITIPCMKNTFVFIFVTATIFNLQRFTDVYMFSEKSFNENYSTIVYYIYNKCFQYASGGGADMGAGSAVSVLLFLFTLAVSIVNIRVMGLYKKHTS